ncbi:hypothetical protein JAAARDRAFT_450341 [Jaapia argillacea MUCL 33604]|uniref:HAT C-terminal dimerisation domain-containing protein n=1 Tax=Jaapia argillacea MUCL 33604 TaxID=933084 RepID=A0A067Q511_9AGAM|nr:hypothetical protein JAAARDRAFT_450341 [Jaapia argillacea MUCL 33604]
MSCFHVLNDHSHCIRGQWRTWKCMNGMSSTIRKHLHNEHQSEYNDACRSLQLKGSSLVPDAAEEDEEAPDYPMTDVKEPTPPPVDPTPASAVDKAKTPTPVVASTTTKPRGRPRNTIPMEPFYDRLVRFIVTSGLPLDVVDSSYFRDLLLFSAGKFIDETKFPNHAKICQLIADRFMAERTRISEDFKNASGRISFTIDIQAEPCPRVVVTAHYCSLNENDTLSVQSRLVAIRRLPRHRAEQDETSRAAQQALVIFDALKSYDVLSKVGAITVADNLLDGRLPEELGKLFAQEGISFNPTFSFSRNLPPAIHDAVEAGLHVLAPTSSSKIDKASASEVPLYNPTLIANKEYTEALENDPVSCIRGIVSAARDSAERRQQLRLLITEEDISANELDADEAVDGVMRSRELLHDDGRWSSTYVMIERALALYPETTQGDVAELALDDADIQVLNDIKEFLRVPFTVHDIVGEERLPLLTTAVPLYEQLLVFLRRIQDTIPEIAHGVSVTLAKLNEYFGKARSNRTYALAMAINPTAKFKWAEDNWTPEQRDQARQWMFDAMLEHYQKLHSVTPTGQGDASATPLPQPTKSATKSLSAMERLMQLSSDRRGSSSSSRPSQPTAGSVSATSPSESSDSGDSKKKEAEKEKAAIDNELRRYIAEGVLDSQEDLDDFNIMQYWKDNAKRFPLMYLVALDVLPTQVPHSRFRRDDTDAQICLRPRKARFHRWLDSKRRRTFHRTYSL